MSSHISNKSTPLPPPPPPPPPSLPLYHPCSAETPQKDPVTSKFLQRHLCNRPQKSFEEQLLDTSKFELDGDESDVLVVASFRHQHGLLQDGPQCGLVALAMAFDVLSSSSPLFSVNDAMDAAKSAGFSNRGEMFSAQFMAKLGNTLTPETTKCHVVDNLSEKWSSVASIVRNFLPPDQKEVFLVPYDIDKDQMPCLKLGRKAHWCLVLGVAVVMSRQALGAVCSSSDVDFLGVEEKICLVNKVNDGKKLVNDIEDCAKRTLLLCRQSKSRRLFLYSLRDLLASNGNLVMSAEEGVEYVMPLGGASEGLKDKAVRIYCEKVN